MKYTCLMLMAVVFLCACSKINQDPEIIVEPPEPVEVRIDSMQAGKAYNITIGDTPRKVYEDLQFFAKGLDHRPYLAISRTPDTQIEALKDRIPLYFSLYFDRKPSTPVGGQIYFEDHKIKSIYTRDGTQRTAWPISSPDALRVGDPVSIIYDKLVKIQADSRYARLFDYIGMFEKNVETAYDPKQEESDVWQFNFTLDKSQNEVVRLNLVFEEGVLVKILSRYERYL